MDDSFLNREDFIIENINSLPISKRTEILQYIINSVSIEKISEKCDGTIIRMSDLKKETILQIFNIIKNNLK